MITPEAVITAYIMAGSLAGICVGVMLAAALANAVERELGSPYEFVTLAVGAFIVCGAVIYPLQWATDNGGVTAALSSATPPSCCCEVTP